MARECPADDFVTLDSKLCNRESLRYNVIVEVLRGTSSDRLDSDTDGEDAEAPQVQVMTTEALHCIDVLREYVAQTA